MFCRRWSGLPSDPEFPTNLPDLGYFVNKDDEIRQIKDEDYYFKYFLTKNDRHNERQRFAFNAAIRDIVISRLKDEGLQTLLLPLGTKNTDVPHVPIMHTADLEKQSRVVLVLGESAQEFGAIAHRVIGGRGGINKGSMIGLVQALKKHKSTATDSSPPGIILANTGELWWWPEGSRGLTPRGRHGIPMASSTTWGVFHNPKVNEIPLNRSPAQHIEYLFEQVLPKLLGSHTKLEIIAVGDAADHAYSYLSDERRWAKYTDTLNCFASLGGYFDSTAICEGFRHFLENSGRCYDMSFAPLGTPLCGPNVNPSVSKVLETGCPVFSAGEACNMIELLLIETQPSLLPWMQEVALNGGSKFVYEVYGDAIPGCHVEEVVQEPVPERDSYVRDESEEQKDNLKDGDAENVTAITSDTQNLSI